MLVQKRTNTEVLLPTVNTEPEPLHQNPKQFWMKWQV